MMHQRRTRRLRATPLLALLRAALVFVQLLLFQSVEVSARPAASAAGAVAAAQPYQQQGKPRSRRPATRNAADTRSRDRPSASSATTATATKPHTRAGRNRLQEVDVTRAICNDHPDGVEEVLGRRSRDPTGAWDYLMWHAYALEHGTDADKSTSILAETCALKLNSSFVDGLHIRAQLFGQNQQFEAAMLDVKRGLALAPRHARLLFVKAITHYALHDHRAGDAAMRQIDTMRCLTAAECFLLADVLNVNMKKADLAVRMFSRALELDPGNAFYGTRLGTLMGALGRRAEFRHAHANESAFNYKDFVTRTRDFNREPTADSTPHNDLITKSTGEQSIDVDVLGRADSSVHAASADLLQACSRMTGKVKLAIHKVLQQEASSFSAAGQMQKQPASGICAAAQQATRASVLFSFLEEKGARKSPLKDVVPSSGAGNHLCGQPWTLARLDEVLREEWLVALPQHLATFLLSTCSRRQQGRKHQPASFFAWMMDGGTAAKQLEFEGPTQDSFGMTAVHLAIIQNDAVTLQALLSTTNGIRSLDITDLFGRTPIDILRVAVEFPARHLMFDVVRRALATSATSNRVGRHFEVKLSDFAIPEARPLAKPPGRSSTVASGCGLARGWMPAYYTFPFGALSSWPGSPVTSVDASSINMATVIRDFVAVGRPLVIKGVLRACPAAQSLWDRSALLDSDLARVPTLFRKYNRNGSGLTTLAEGISELLNTTALTNLSRPHYIFNSPLLDTSEGTLADSSAAYLLDRSIDAISYTARMEPMNAIMECIPYELQEYFNLPPPGAPGSWNDWTLSLGSTGAGSNFHTHHLAVNVMIHGAKRWFVYPPAASFFSNLPAFEWVRNVYPTLDEDAKPVEIMQESGDLVILPGWWTHATVNTGDTLAIFKVLENPSFLPGQQNPPGPFEAVEAKADEHTRRWLVDGPPLQVANA